MNVDSLNMGKPLFGKFLSLFLFSVGLSDATFAHQRVGFVARGIVPKSHRLHESATTLDYEVEPVAIRIGHGFDIHRMSPIEQAGQPIVIGGVVIEHKDQKWLDVEGKYVERGEIYETQLGVEAHSDGDVIYHSIVDAIFGALTLPDIGQVFQDTDPRWRGCDSSK